MNRRGVDNGPGGRDRIVDRSTGRRALMGGVGGWGRSRRRRNEEERERGKGMHL